MFLTLVPAALTSAIAYQVTFPFVAVVLLREIWAKGWFVPEEREGSTTAPTKLTATEPPQHEPISLTKVLRRSAAIAGAVAFAYGPVEVKAAIVGFAAIWLLVWFWTSFDYR